MGRILLTAILAIALQTANAGCSKDSNPVVSYDPEIDPADFVDTMDNPFLSFIPGTTFFYEGESDGESESNKVYVSHETIEIMGVTCVIVYDTVWADGELIEATADWYAQDKDGTVWYFGEDSKEIEGGVVVSTEGSWKAGVDDAKPGIVMKGDPKVGDKYRQEYYEDEAEDEGQVVALDASVTVPYGSYTNCLKTKEWTRLEPGVVEYKFYKSGVGQVMEADEDGEPLLELISKTTE
jgi:hypothetical protein